jgi:branched-chain amino acid transport system substrate-binding protein
MQHFPLAVILEIGDGSFESGFAFALKVLQGRQLVDSFEGRLPPAPQLPEIYRAWKAWYESLGQSTLITIVPNQVTHVKKTAACAESSAQLKAAINDWLNHPSLKPIERRLIRTMPEADGLRFFVQTRDPILKRLPWQLWDLLEDFYPNAEVLLSAEFLPAKTKLVLPVRILAIEGDISNTQATLDLRPIEAIPGSQITRLQQPTVETLRHELWQGSWDILVFVGHSRSQENTGVIDLNPSESLSLAELHEALKFSVRNGLKLAIFNSCDGVGIASQLASLKIPYTIVMREQVPDQVAQTFLQTLLVGFSRGKSLHQAVHTARCKLQELSQKYPQAAWLPVIYQNPAAPEIRYPKPKPWRKVVLSSGAICALLAGVSFPYWQQFTPWHPEHQDFLQRSSFGEDILTNLVNPQNPGKAKLEGAKAFREKNYAEAVKKFRKALNDVSNDPEALIYYNNAILRAKGYKTHHVAVSVPIGTNLNVAQEILRGVAQKQDSLNQSQMRQGLPIEVMIVNDNNDPRIAQNVARQLSQDPSILAVIGHNASDASVAAAPIYNDTKLVMLTPTSFSDRLSGQGDYTFRMVPTIIHIARRLAEYARVKHPGATIAVCADYGSVDNESYKKRFVEVLQSSPVGRSLNLIDLNCNMDDSEMDKAAKINEMKQKGATVLMVAPHIDRIAVAIPMLQAAKRAGITLLGSSTFYTAQTLDQGRDSIKGMVLSVPWTTKGESVFEQVAQGLWGGRPSWRTAMAYDAMQVVADGLNREPSREGLKQALQDPKFMTQGATGKIQFINTGEFKGDRLNTTALGALVMIKAAPSSSYGVDFEAFPMPSSPTEKTSKTTNVSQK